MTSSFEVTFFFFLAGGGCFSLPIADGLYLCTSGIICLLGMVTNDVSPNISSIKSRFLCCSFFNSSSLVIGSLSTSCLLEASLSEVLLSSKKRSSISNLLSQPIFCCSLKSLLPLSPQTLVWSLQHHCHPQIHCQIRVIRASV